MIFENLYNFLNDWTNTYPFLGVIFSIILIIGFFKIGEFFLKFNFIKDIFINISDLNYLKIFFGINIFLLLAFPIVIFEFYTEFLVSFFAISIFIIGLLALIKQTFTLNNFKINFKSFETDNNKYMFDKIIFLIFILGLFFLSLAPTTQSDALGYHMFAGKSIIENGNLPFSILHLHSFLVGSGEILIALGLFFGADQFGGLVQFSGLIGLIGVCKKFAKKDYFILLLLISSPVLIFLASSPKPQLFFACSNAIILSIYLFNSNIKISKTKELFSKYLISILFLVSSINGKFSFILSSTLIILLILADSVRNKKIYSFILALSLSFMVFYFPMIYWKFLNFSGNFTNYLLSPLPLHLSFFVNFNEYLVNYGRDKGFLSLIVPTSFGEITSSLGFTCVYIFFIFKKNINEKIILLFLIIIFTMVIFFKGQLNARFFIEPYFWLIILMAKHSIHKYNLSIINFGSYIQVLCILVITWYGVFTLSIGSLSKDLRNKVMTSTANGYTVFNWANKLLNKDDKVLSLHRSISFADFDVMPGDFLSWNLFNDKKENNYVKKIILKEKPSYILYTLGDEILFQKCLGNIIHKGEVINNHATRNPFNKKSKSSNVYIQKFNYKKFPECLDKIINQ
jgi:hypothetical protein